jgi:hypothetical protein
MQGRNNNVRCMKIWWWHMIKAGVLEWFKDVFPSEILYFKKSLYFSLCTH